MKIKIKKDNNHLWSFVEIWDQKYFYEGEGVIKSLFSLGLDVKGFTANPLTFKEGVFQPLTSSLQHYSMEEWLASKKPVYSPLGAGALVKFIIRYDLSTLKPIFEKSSFELYSPILELATEEYVPLTRVFNISESLGAKLNSVMLELFSEEVSRKKFLERRIEASEVFKGVQNN